MDELIDYKYCERGKDRLNDRSHSHGNCYEIVQVISGDGVFTVNNKIFPLMGGVVYLINGISLHCSNPRHPSEYIRNKIVISARIIDKAAEALECKELTDTLFGSHEGCPIQLEEEKFSQIDEKMKRIGEALGSDKNLERIHTVMGVLDICLSLRYCKSETVVPVGGVLADVLDYINEHIGDKLTLDLIGRHVNLNKFYLCHLFRQTTGMTVSEYILERRLSAAKRKLLLTEMSVSEIAMSTGFGSFSYFSRVFREKEGLCPSEFRKRRRYRME